MKCEHDNCLTCPYPDCISEKGPADRVKKKPGRKKMDPEEKRQNKKRWMQEYYIANKERFHKRSQQYYQENADKIREQQRKYRNEKLGVPEKEIMTIWMTDGKINKRVNYTEYDAYKKKGWMRGRTMTKIYKKEKNNGSKNISN